jgi:hypothetical protein
LPQLVDAARPPVVSPVGLTSPRALGTLRDAAANVNSYWGGRMLTADAGDPGLCFLAGLR